MNILDSTKKAIELLNKVEEYFDICVSTLSDCDKKIDCLEHYIEFENIKVTQAYRILKEIKKLRIVRRKCKNDMDLITTYKNNSTKLCNASNRSMLLNEIYKKNNRLENLKYKYDAYTEDEFSKIIGDVR